MSSNVEQDSCFEPFSEVRVNMTKQIPSKCEKCGEGFPSKSALISHKATVHRATPNMKATNSMKQSDSSIKEKVAKKVMSDAGRTPRTPSAAGSPTVMNNWINGATRSNEIGAAIARSRDTPRTGIEPVPPEERTNTLDDSVSLLQDAEIQIDPASPFLTTMRMFPPTLQVTPASEAGEWIVTQGGIGAEDRAPEPEPEKAKRSRERYPDEVTDDIKKTDDKKTPEAMRPVRRLEGELQQAQGLETLEIIDMEFNSVEVETVEWNTGTEGQSQSPSQASTQASTQPSESQDSGATLKSGDLMTPLEREWFSSDNFESIPHEQDYGQEQDQEQMDTAPVDSLELQEAEHERSERNTSLINELRNKLEESESRRQDYWEEMQRLEAEISDLKEEAMRNNNLAQSHRATMARANQAEMRVAELTDILKEKQDEMNEYQSLAERKMQEAGKKYSELVAQTENSTAKAVLDKDAEIKKLEGEMRAEVQRLRAINTKAVNEIKALNTSNAVITELKTNLVKVEAERDMEKFKAQKAQEAADKMENISRGAQQEKAQRDQRIEELEHRIKTMARQLPCGRENCDMSCGRDHHCGQGGGRNRSRNRGQRRNHSAGPAPPIPTVANLADAAGCSNDAMQQVVNGVVQDQNNRLPPHPRNSNLPPRPPKGKKDWKVGLCHDFHYFKLCPRGDQCKNAHELVGANIVARARDGTQPRVPQPSQPSAPNPRARSAGRQLPAPAVNPDHPWFRQNNSAAQAGNVNGQRPGAAAVLPSVPQPLQPLQSAGQPPRPQLSGASAQGPFAPRPRSFSEAASGDAAARQTVRESMDHQASAGAQIKAMRTQAWKDTLDNAFGVSATVFPELRSPSGQRPGSDSRPRTHSLGSAPPAPPATRGSGI